ncbi:AAA family ATPase [Crocinitomix catalasitica]|uniref:AAA family ATPase n=1 Tax=Crocinitomix catalasitica TaxID=184607 RepID=UPI00055A594A|nr:AAA family ATPase [Crocinitomix catalasitica]
MSKIKKIEISDFRIYEGKVDFNFEGDNGIPNLVALYAPNGYGKTSFFDAIEWSFSDQIKRFQNDFIKKAINDEQENTILLTNTNSYRNGIQGKVKILTNNDSFLEKNVKKRRKNGTAFFNDYRQGDTTKGSIRPIENELNQIPETNILTQDQIDAFLRFKTPEQKFDALKDFWPESENATKRLKQISDLRKVVSNNLDHTVKKIEEFKSDLVKLANNDKNIEQINAWLKKIKEQKTYERNNSIDKIDGNITQENYDIIYDENLRNIKGISLKIEQGELIKSELTKLKDTLVNYVFDSEKSTNLKKELIELQNRKSSFLNLKKSNEIAKSISNDIEKLKLSIEKYKYIDSNIVGFKSDIKKIEDFNIVNQSSIKQNTRILDHIQIIKESISNFKQHEKKCSLTRLETEKKELSIDQQYEEFTTINNKLKGQEKEVTVLKEKISKKEIEIEKLQKKNQEFNRIIEDEVYPNTILLENENYIALCNNLKDNIEQIDLLKVKVELKQKELDKSGTLNENLDRLILFGEDYITKTNSSDCPLCKTTFKSFEDLIDKVKLDKKDTLKLNEQENEISELINKISEIQKSKTTLIDKLKNIISLNIEGISKKIDLTQNEKNILVNKINDINNTTKILEYELKNCTDFFRDTFNETIVINKINVDTLKKNIHQDILKLKEKESRFKKIIKTKEDVLLKKETTLLINESILSKNKNSIESIQNQERYQKIIKIADELNISDSQLEKSIIENKLKLDTKELSDKSESFSLISKELNSIEKNIKEDKLQIDESNIEGIINDTESLIKKCKENIDEFESKFRKHITSKEITEEAINVHQLENQNNLDDLLIIKSDLNKFSIDLELIKENIKSNELEKEIKRLETLLPRLQNSYNKIDATRKECMNYVATGINNYFNKEVINEVYRRIEPHPKLTKIEFTTDFNDKGEPRLLIKTGTENDDEGVNPVLFLSAGQVNVLSLSIFLAKAFEYGNKTIETIFMDDPIQNLSDINVLSFIDLLRTLISTHDKQIVISTHDEKFFRLLQNKLPEEYCNTKYFEFESEGKLK